MRTMKDSGVEWVGEIPETWHVNALKRIAQIQTGSTPSKKEGNNYYSDEGGIPWIKPENLNSMLPIVNTSEYLNDAGAKIGRVFKPHTTFVACIASVGKTGYSDVICSCNQQINGITFSDNIFWKYGYYALTASAIEHIAKSNTSVQAILNSQQEGYIKLPIPSYDEQRSIVSYLDEKCSAIDEAIARHQSSIEKLEEYKRATIIYKVSHTDKNVEYVDSNIPWMPTMPKTWAIVPLKYAVTQRINKNLDMCEKNLLTLSYGEIKRKNIETNEGLLPASFEGYNIIEKDDIVLRLLDLQNDTRSLRTGLVTERGIITSAYVTITPSSVFDSMYCRYLLHAYDLMKVLYTMGEGVRQSLSFDELSRKMLVPVPLINEQRKIAEDISIMESNVNEAIARMLKNIEKLEEYKKSLIYNAVTGKIDCRK